MKAAIHQLIGIAMLTAGIIGFLQQNASLSANAPWLTMAGAALFCFYALKWTYRSPKAVWPKNGGFPAPIRLQPLSYLKALIAWLDAFSRSYAVRPGLYFTGPHYDREAPLLVTSNYFLTVFLLLRRLSNRNVRILVVDTGGINVWCSAGKGSFSHEAVLKELDPYERELLTREKRLRMILPKLAFAGVAIDKLREAKIQPIVGPVLARDLPAFLDATPWRDCRADRFHFTLRPRLFAWLPGLIQFTVYSLILAASLLVLEGVAGVRAPVGLINLTALLVSLYTFFFPWIPARRFAAKGVLLALSVTPFELLLAYYGRLSWVDLPMIVLFTFATSIFYGLSFTGNSAVSNYTLVRKETAQFLIPNVALYLASFAALWTREWCRC